MMNMRLIPDLNSYQQLNSAGLRENFLLDSLFVDGSINLTYVDQDRTVIGGIVPKADALALTCPEELRADYFTERREIGVFNTGGAGAITVDAFDLDCQVVKLKLTGFQIVLFCHQG